MNRTISLHVHHPSKKGPISGNLRWWSLLAIQAVFTLAITPSLVQGSIIYGDFLGSTVKYLDVTEDSSTDPVPLYGPPNVTGDSLDFDPVGFSANAAGAGGSDITDGNLRFVVEAMPLHAIWNIGLSEQGDTALAGFGTDATMTSVTSNIFVDILEVDGAPITQINLSTMMVFTPSAGDYKLMTDGGGGPVYQTNWSGSVLIDLNQALITAGEPFVWGATKIAVNLDNTLVALSEAGTQSFIAKKDFDGMSVTVNIPEPSCLVLFGLTLLGLAAIFFRHK
ncbi:MAG: hypothetical protein JW829_20700 [Pirellulales bacterium]|nr:hypothetical protein [Pirellulales bacterium]